MVKVLSVASEVYPLIKTGGLADVAGALPGALAAQGVEMTTLVPGYPAVMHALKARGKARNLGRMTVLGEPVHLLEAKLDGAPLIVLDAPQLFERDGGPYSDQRGLDFPDNWKRFGVWSRTAADLVLDPKHDFTVLHAHDWQASMAAAYLAYGGGRAAGKRSVVTIHNLAFQGRFDAGIFASLDLPAHAYSLDGVEYYGGVGFLKGGLQLADAITTVSPTYASEVLDPHFGMGMEGLLAARSADLFGIVNGIDPKVWSPEKDPHLAKPYTAKTLKNRKANKRKVEQEFGLAEDDGPLLCVVSRLTWQKGMDVLVEQLDSAVALGARLALLGTGDPGLEAAFLDAARRHPGRIGVRIGYDEALSHLVQGGSDAILIPSRFEPCGLTQLYGLAYGCTPVVARTGGLADTVIDANEAALGSGAATGFVMDRVDGATLHRTLRRVVELHARPNEWARLQKEGMKADFSWGRSAGLYADLYRRLAKMA